MLNKRFIKAKKVLEIIESHHHKAYFVGGAVRDQFLNKINGDIDIATSAKPEEIQQMFDKVIPVGIEHGTVVVLYNDESYEVTTFRIEGSYSDNRHPDSVEFVDQIEEDLARRDFTINAIAMKKDGHYIDPYHGQEDINLSLIRTVGNPKERFKEDPLRMLRALRFSSQLGFSIEERTLNVLVNHMEWIKKIAIERIVTELEKMFAGKHIQQALKLFFLAEADTFIPLLGNSPLFKNNLLRLKEPLLSLSEIIAALHIIDSSITVDDWTRKWKLSNRINREAKNLVSSLNYLKQNTLDNWLAYSLSTELFEGFTRISHFLNDYPNISLSELKDIYVNLPITKRSDLKINGNEIAQLFTTQKKGPWIGAIINKIEFTVVQGRLPNNKNDIEEWVVQWNPLEEN